MAHQYDAGARRSRGLGDQAMSGGARGRRQPAGGLRAAPGPANEPAVQAAGDVRAASGPVGGVRLQAVIDMQHEQVAADAARPGVGGDQQGERVAAAGEGDADRRGGGPRQAPVEDGADRRLEVGAQALGQPHRASVRAADARALMEGAALG